MSLEAKTKMEKLIEDFFAVEPSHSKNLMDEILPKMVELKKTLEQDSVTIPQAWDLVKEISPLIKELEKSTSKINTIIGNLMSDFKRRVRRKEFEANKRD